MYEHVTLYLVLDVLERHGHVFSRRDPHVELVLVRQALHALAYYDLRERLHLFEGLGAIAKDDVLV